MKKYDLSVVVETYTTSNGEQKNKRQRIGTVMEKDGRMFMLLDRHFNPAGIANPDNKSSIIVSMFEPSDKPAKPAPQEDDSFSDDIPF